VTKAARALAESAAILSDLDGTLIDSSEAVQRVWDRFSKRHGLDTRTVIDYVYGRPPREAIRVLLPEADHEAEAAAIDAAELRDVAGVRGLPGAAELLNGGHPLAIVTSCTDALARARLAAAGLPAPEVLISADSVAHGKPDPACFLLAADRLGVPIANCVVLEDSPAGITAGRLAGAQVIGLPTTRPREALVEADFLAEDLASLIS